MLIIPTQAEYFLAYALKNMMSAIGQVRAQENPSLIYRILVTMYDGRNRTHNTLLEQLHATFGSDGLLNTVIDVDTKLRESNHWNPDYVLCFNSRSAEQYRSMAEELIKNVKELKRKSTQ